MVERADLRLVDDERALAAMLEALAEVDRLGLDTEFHAEHRYRPELMLVQIATPDGRVWIVDARAINPKPLAALLERAMIVVHGGAQDVEILHRVTGALPRRILDTQRAAALLGMGFPSRLGAVVQQALDVKIDKAVGLTDWSIRPLSVRQLQYAGEDARILLPLADALEVRLAARGRLGWALEASAEIVEDARRGSTDADAWMSWDIAALLDDDERKAIRALFAWRETTGRAMDQPPRQVLSDALALDLARRRPMTLGELIENRRIPQGMVKRHGAPLIAELRRVASEPPPPRPPGPELVLRAQALELWAGMMERREGVARALALPRALALRTVVEGPGALTGWRAAALGEDLARLLRGEDALKFAPSGDLELVKL